jgi:hypothetical protein
MTGFQVLTIDQQVEKAYDVLMTLAIEDQDTKMQRAMKKLLVYIMRSQVVFRFDNSTCELEIKSAGSESLYVCKNTKHTKYCSCQTNPSKATCWHKAAWSLLYILHGGKVSNRTQELVDRLGVFAAEIKADEYILDLI